jgi:iron uptake system EfeUOB component EfeO/EfeM
MNRTGAGAGVVVLLALAGCSTPAPPAPTTVEVTRGGCATGWTKPHGGAQTIRIHNVGTVTMEVELTDPATHGIYAETESLGPGTTRPMSVVLGNGSYAFTCYPDESDAETGPTVTIKDGPATGGMAAIPPTSENDLAASVTAYRGHVTAGLAALAARSAGLRTAIHGGDRAGSRAAWLQAQLAYSRLGAAYGTFGDSADAIDGLPSGLPRGVHDKDFTGLRRIEWGLWHAEAMSALEPIAAGLVGDVASLRKDFAAERTDPNDLPLRSHEILENSLQFELTGDADQGAGDGLAIIGANLEGTRAVLAAIAPVIRPKYAGWAGVQTDLDKMTKLVAAQHRGAGWTAPAALPARDRERLAGTLGELLERLAPIAAIGEVRRVE